jgi:hypothetical protein
MWSWAYRENYHDVDANKKKKDRRVGGPRELVQLEIIGL